MNKNKIKIAHIQLLPLLTGVQRVSLDELMRLDADMYEKYMICQSPGPMTTECLDYDVSCLYNSDLCREISLFRDIKAFYKLYRYFKTNEFDIVHSHSSKTGVLGRLAAKLAGVPMIVHTVHGFAFPSTNSKLKRAIYFLMEWIGTKCSDRIICLHDKDKMTCRNELGAKEEQLMILANGVNKDSFSVPTTARKLQCRNALSLPAEAIVVGMLGRLWAQKNPQALLDSALCILAERDDVHFVFSGDGELKAGLETQVPDANKANFHFLGWRSDTDVVLNALDIFVLPSLWEGMPLAVLEAQSSGLPCVVSDIQGNNHLVHDHDNGLLFPLAEPSKLTEALKHLIESAPLRQQLGSKARADIERDYDINKRIEKLSRMYESFLAQR